MGKFSDNFSWKLPHTTVCNLRSCREVKSRPERLRLSFHQGKYKKPLSVTLEVGLWALLDTISCLENLAIADLVRLVHYNKDPVQSLSESLKTFCAHYFYRRALSPLSDPMEHVFKLPGLKLSERPVDLNQSIFRAWKRQAGLSWLEFPKPCPVPERSRASSATTRRGHDLA
jgi:predicted DNA-binding ribbon-helix-helix protein